MAEMITIDDSNYRSFIDPVVDGERKRCSSHGVWSGITQGGYRGTFDDLASVPLIPEDEWGDRIRQQEKDGNRLPDMAKDLGLKIRNQDGTNYCHTEDTEVLTSDGWVMWPHYDYKTSLATVNPYTHKMEWQRPFEKHVYRHRGRIVYSTNNRLDFGVTEDHRMMVRKWNEKERTLNGTHEFCRAGDLGWYSGFLSAPSGSATGVELVEVQIPNDRKYSGDDFVMMISLIVSDGWAGGVEKTKNCVSFACFDRHPERQKVVRNLARRIGFKEQPGRPGVFNRWNAGALAEWIRKACYGSPDLGSDNKRVPRIIKDSSSRQIKLFLEMYGDQSHTKKEGADYFSTSKQCIDDLQELCLSVGKRGNVRLEKDRPHKSMWHMSVAHGKQLSIERKKQIEVESYDGHVYCAGVPNGTLITRRNGTVLISGNCWAFGTCRSAEYAILQTGVNLFISPASVASPIKGFRNHGGWGDQALDYMAKYGFNTHDEWPQDAIDRRYYTDANKTTAKNRLVLEYYKLRSGRDGWAEVVSCILAGYGVAVGYNWWRHLVCGTWLTTGLDLGIDNSWGSNWSDGGRGILSGNRKYPDGAVVITTVAAM